MHKFLETLLRFKRRGDCLIIGVVKTMFDFEFYQSLCAGLPVIHCGHVIEDEDVPMLHNDPYNLRCGHCGTYLFSEPKEPECDHR